MMLLHAGNKLIGLQAGCIVDGEETPAWRVARVAHNHEGQGLQRELGEHVQANLPDKGLKNKNGVSSRT